MCSRLSPAEALYLCTALQNTVVGECCGSDFIAMNLEQILTAAKCIDLGYKEVALLLIAY
ncbi:hypothetical protein SERLADRAFT_379380 [Serpula lacrymans var. lacrymans S7.9]|nr:uncharacterized protein SERLADRAFT_379380 [Serpula lacrymans var. lacrymans S7.9]EGO29868.1 hypothetical protein SERLADRAFT_379380 [Serpula lacrymans var. lacrymans S7.9]